MMSDDDSDDNDSTGSAAPATRQYVIPTDKDFLRGRGGTTNTREANQRVLRLIRGHKEEYKKIKRRGDKAKFARKHVVKGLRREGGRFLGIEKAHDGSIRYYAMDKKSSTELVQQKLRESEKKKNCQGPMEVADIVQDDATIEGSFSEDDNAFTTEEWDILVSLCNDDTGWMDADGMTEPPHAHPDAVLLETSCSPGTTKHDLDSSFDDFSVHSDFFDSPLNH